MKSRREQHFRESGFLVGATNDGPLLAWSGEAMDTKFFLLHFLVEFLGSALLLFMNCQVTSSPNGTADSVGFWQFTVFGGVRWLRPSATLNPFETFFADIFIFRLYESWTGLFKVLGTIGFQIAGGVFGTWLSYFFQGSNSAAFAVNLTTPIGAVPITTYQMMLGDAMGCFGMGVVAFSYIYQTVQDYRTKTQKAPMSSSVEEASVTPGELQALPKIESVAVASVLFLAIVAFYYTTHGSFVLTRALGPAMILNDYTNIGYYILGQVVGMLLAVCVVLFVLFDH